MKSPSPLARFVAIPPEVIGLLIWLVVIVSAGLTLAESILLWAPLVLVPMTLRLLQHSPFVATNQDERLLTIARRVQLPAAFLLAVSYCFPAGLQATLLTVPWLVLTACVALAGLLRATHIWRRPLLHLPEISLIGGMLFLVVGGGWTMISRGGWRPLEFDDTIVLLTGVHFHYAGLMLPVLAGLAARESAGWLIRISKLSIVAILIGVPGVGVGITYSPQVEVLAALQLATGCLWLIATQLRLAMISRQATLLLLWSVSSLALLSGMSLAGVYAVGEFSEERWLTIPTMIPLHGITQAFGFASCGLLAWTCREFGCFPPARHS